MRIVIADDRFGRSLVDTLAAIERIEAAGGTFASVQDGLDLAEPFGEATHGDIGHGSTLLRGGGRRILQRQHLGRTASAVSGDRRSGRTVW